MQPLAESTAIYSDLGGLAQLRGRSRSDQQGAMKEVAQQFEALFLNMMLKQMRESGFGDSLFDSSAGKNYQSMFDQQLALNLSKQGSLGIAEMVERQLSANLPTDTDAANPFKGQAFVAPRTISMLHKPSVLQATTVEASGRITSGQAGEKSAAFDKPEQFVAVIWPHAEKAARELGIPTETLVSQAALETGWGKYMMTQSDGENSYNLFGIKADHRWQGDRVTVTTTEYRNGVVQKERAAFRAYDSFADSFDDYVVFLQSSPRYADALQNGGSGKTFLQGLQQAGYATDPAYASKIGGIMRGETLNIARASLHN